MEAYTAFAKVYDKFMENVPYDRWTEFIDFIIRKYGVSEPKRDATDALESERNLVLDMGCGTGTVTRLMYDRGYDMIGVDLSQEMLDEAYSKCTEESYGDILYICQDMCDLDLYSTVGTVISICDSVNYLIEDEEIKQCFDNVSNYLYPGGLFIFDFNTIYKYRDVIGDRTIAEADEECSFIWDNFFSEEDNVNEYDLTLFIKDDESGLYRRDVETHYQRGYSIDEMSRALKESGLTLLAMCDEQVLEADSYKEIVEKQIDNAVDNHNSAMINVNEKSQRVFVIAGKDS